MGLPVLCFCTLPESHSESQRYQNRSLGWRPAGGRMFPGAPCAVFLHAPSGSQRITTVPKPKPGLAPCGKKKVPSGPLCCVFARSQRVATSHKGPKPQPGLAHCGRKKVPWRNLCCVFLHAPSGSPRIPTVPKPQPGLAPCGRKKVPSGHLCCVFARSQRITTNHNGPKTAAWACALREEEGSLGRPVPCFCMLPMGHNES